MATWVSWGNNNNKLSVDQTKEKLEFLFVINSSHNLVYHWTPLSLEVKKSMNEDIRRYLKQLDIQQIPVGIQNCDINLDLWIYRCTWDLHMVSSGTLKYPEDIVCNFYIKK